jgi:hypothetical protein
MSQPNNDPFIAGANSSDSADDFLRIHDEDIDQDPPEPRQGQPEKSLLFNLHPTPTSTKTPKPSSNNYTAPISNPITIASAPPPAPFQTPPVMNTNNDQLTADQVGHAIMNSLAIQDTTLTPKQFKGTSVE